MAMRVDVGIAISKVQSPNFWGPLMGQLLRIEQQGIATISQIITVGSALSDHNKNGIAEIFCRPDNTAENRNAIVAESLGAKEERADAIWFVDDDTQPPDGALEALLKLNADICAGVYFGRAYPHAPLAYKRLPNGLYIPEKDYRRGEIMRVDSVGMGCTLVHRAVFERIRENYRLFYRGDTHSTIAVHKDDLVDYERAAKQVRGNPDRVLITNDGIYRMQRLAPLEEEPEAWPYYEMEYGRTEDHAFCEKALRCGCTILVDTAVECTHIGESVVTQEDFHRVRRDYLRRKLHESARD